MKTIFLHHMVAARCCTTAAVICLVLAFLYPVMLLGTAAFLLLYWGIDRRCLRCRYCRAHINLDRLNYARKYEAYCPHCGGPIQIVRRQGRRK